MCCEVIKDELMIRLSPAATLAELDSLDARLCDFTKRPMPGFFIINARGCDDQKSVGRWVRLALNYVLSLQPK